MPPKASAKKQDKGNKKSEEKKTTKVAEDKTFGLKNKKGKKTQNFISGVQRQQADKIQQLRGGPPVQKVTKKELEKQKLEELNKLFKPVQAAQKIADGVDPKSVLCIWFKSGGCTKGDKCKFSHDLSIERKSEKRNMFDTGEEEEGNKDNMNNWTQQELEDAINQKHGAENAAKPKTSIICKHFLDAVEKSQYGWFWACPAGASCIYKHALPPGYVLKRDMKKEDDDETKQVALEEHIENERQALTGTLTPVTLQTFLVWKNAKMAEKKAKYETEQAKKKKEFAKGKNTVSGRDIFLFKPELAENDGDDEDGGAFDYRKRGDDGEIIDEEAVFRELTLESIALEAAQIDDTKITKALTGMSVKERLAHTSHQKPDEDRLPPPNHATMNGDTNGLAEATGGLDEQAAAAAATLDDVPIDESLFEDLDDLEDLDIEDDDDEED